MDCEYLFLSSDLPTKCFEFFEGKKKEFCDITIQMGERTVSAHRIILSAAIPYFYKIFSGNDALDSQEKLMPLTDVDSYALELMINFAYTSRVKINMGNVKDLMSAAYLLQVDEVKDACCRFLVDRLNIQNVLSIRELSSKLNCTELQEKADSYIRANFEEISETPDFLNIPFDLLIELSKRDDLKVQSEERLFEAIIKWVKHSTKERKVHIPALLRNVRLALVKPTYIINHIQKEKLIRKSMECRDLLEEITYYHLFPEERGLCSFPTKARSLIASDCDTTSGGTACICVINTEGEYQVQCLDLAKGLWRTNVYRNFTLNNDHTVAEINKKLYCFLPEVTYAYDLERGNLLFSKGMTLPRYWAGSAAHGNKLYVLGGRVYFAAGLPSSNAAECFDPVSEEWRTLKSMKTCRGAPGVVSSAEYIYVLGGRQTHSCVLNTAEKFHVSTGVWKAMPPMLTKRCALGCAVLNDKIYVCGGQSIGLTATAEVFDAITNEWKQIASLNTARKCCKLVPWDGKLYALGGVGSTTNVTSVEVYEPEKDKWIYGSAMSRQIPVVGASVVYLHSV